MGWPGPLPQVSELWRLYRGEVRTKDPALVKELLGHASVVSTNVYLHARWDDMRAAVDAHARALGKLT